LRQLSPRIAEAAQAEGQEFGLLVARRNLNGSLELIGDAAGDVRLLERAAKRLIAR
jgi:hypothetical protein